jgi:hypothetical protein
MARGIAVALHARVTPSRLAALCLLLATYACASSGDDGGPNDSTPVDGTPEGRQPIKPGDQPPGTKPGGTDPPAPPFSLPKDGSLPKIRRVQTEHLGQLTNTQTNRSWENGIVGTDLGATFERDGKLVYIFGDSWTPGGQRQDQDSIAWSTDSTSPAVGALPKLTWVTDGNNQFVAPKLSGVNLGGMNVPMEGIPVGTKTYVFFTSGWNASTDTYSNSVLAEMSGLNVAGIKLTHNVASKKFINVSAVVEGNTAFIYGSGAYRKSPVHLAKVDVNKIGDRDQWQYLRSGSGASATFGTGEDSAQPIAPTPCVGELSVRKWEKIGLYFMAYNCLSSPRGIMLRWARAPEGPWSEPLDIFDPHADGGYQHFMHAKQSEIGYDDGLSEPNRYEEWGGEYGPYLIPRYFEEEANGVLSLVYVMSTWNPYQAHLMRTRIALEENPSTAKARGDGLAKAKLVNADFSQGLTGWQASGTPFIKFTGTDGKPNITTYVDGDGATGKIWQDFTVDATTSELSFKVYGGDARVMLVRGNEVVRSTQARRSNDNVITAKWNITDLRGDQVRLVVDDSLTDAWGFVSVSGFELK